MKTYTVILRDAEGEEIDRFHYHATTNVQAEHRANDLFWKNEYAEVEIENEAGETVVWLNEETREG